MKKKLSLFTKTLMGLVNHKSKNGYPEGPIHERRRMPKHELEKMEYYTYDSEGNNYEIYRKVYPAKGKGNDWETVKYYNYRGREVKEVWPKEERIKKPKKGSPDPEPAITFSGRVRSKWVQVESYWDKQDIEEYVDLITDEQIKKTKFWYSFPVDEVEIPSMVKLIMEDVNQLIQFNGKFRNLNTERELAEESAAKMKVILDELQGKLPKVEEKDASMVREVIRALDIHWVHILSDHMRYVGIRDIVKELSYSEVLKLKEVRFEYKKRLTLQKASDDESIAHHMGIEQVVRSEEEFRTK